MKGQTGMIQEIIDIVPTLQSSERIESAQHKLIILHRLLDRKEGENPFRLLAQIEPAGQLDQVGCSSIVPARGRLIENLVRLLRMQLETQIRGKQCLFDVW